MIRCSVIEKKEETNQLKVIIGERQTVSKSNCLWTIPISFLWSLSEQEKKSITTNLNSNQRPLITEKMLKRRLRSDRKKEQPMFYWPIDEKIKPYHKTDTNKLLFTQIFTAHLIFLKRVFTNKSANALWDRDRRTSNSVVGGDCDVASQQLVKSIIKWVEVYEVG